MPKIPSIYPLLQAWLLEGALAEQVSGTAVADSPTAR